MITCSRVFCPVCAEKLQRHRLKEKTGQKKRILFFEDPETHSFSLARIWSQESDSRQLKCTWRWEWYQDIHYWLSMETMTMTKTRNPYVNKTSVFGLRMLYMHWISIGDLSMIFFFVCVYIYITVKGNRKNHEIHVTSMVIQKLLDEHGIKIKVRREFDSIMDGWVCQKEQCSEAVGYHLSTLVPI